MIQFLLPYLPRFFLLWYATRLLNKVVSAKEEIKSINKLLEDVDPKAIYEYTEGFRTHLIRRLDECYAKQCKLIRIVDSLETIIFTPRV